MTLLRQHSHRLLVVVGASGAGKDHVLNGWLASLAQAERPHRARRVITRAAGDPHEDHEPLDEAGFRAAQRADALAFAWQAHGLHYGVRWTELAPLARGHWVVMNGSRAHLPQLRAVAAQARVIEIAAPDALRAARLSARAREAGAHVRERLSRSVGAPPVDLRIDNDGDAAVAIACLDAFWQRLAAAELSA